MKTQNSVLTRINLLILLTLMFFHLPANEAWDYGEYTPVQEDISKRDMYSKHFPNPDGTYTAFISPKPVHYLNGNGDWEEIELNVAPTLRSGFAYGHTANLYQAFFPTGALAHNGVELTVDGRKVTIGAEPKLLLLDSNFNRLAVLEQAQPSDIHISQTAVTYENLMASADNAFVIEPGRIKNNLILKSLPAMAALAGNEYLGYAETIELPQGWTIADDSEGIQGDKAVYSSLEITDNTGTFKAMIPLANTYELQNEFNRVQYPENPGYYLRKLGNNQWELITLVPVDWLMEAGRQFPVVIDPTVSLTQSNYGTVRYDRYYSRYYYRSSGRCRLSSSSYLRYYQIPDEDYFGNYFGFRRWTNLCSGNNYSYDRERRRMYLQYDISSLNAAFATQVEFRLNISQNTANGNSNIEVTSVSDIPFATNLTYGSSSSSTIYNDLANPVYYTINVGGTGNYGFYNLGRQVVTDYNAMLPNGKFMLSLHWPYNFDPPNGNNYGYRVGSATLKVTYTVCGQPAVSANITNVSCTSTNDGSIDLILSGGTGSFTFNWSNGATTEDISNLARGIYQCTIANGQGAQCDIVKEYIVHDPNQPFEIAPNSLLVTTSSQKAQIQTWLGTTMAGELLYRGSVDGFTASAFHAKCDNQGATLFIARNAATNEIFGGYNPVSWTSSDGYHPAPGAFLFNLTEGNQFPLLSGGNQRYATYHHNAYGPTFGGGHDVYFNNNMNTISAGYSYFGHTYDCVVGTYGSSDCREAFTGEYNFMIDEIEVYSVVPYTPFNFDADNDGYDICQDCDDMDASLHPGVNFIDVAGTMVQNTTCTGASDGSIDLALGKGNPPFTYIWSNGSTVEDPNGLAAGNYQVTVTEGGGCTATASFTVNDGVASCSITWTGGTSNDWNDPTNWSGGAVPTSSEDISIDGSITPQPTITGLIFKEVKDITFTNNATVTIDGGSSLTIHGDMTGAASFSGTGTMKFSPGTHDVNDATSVSGVVEVPAGATLNTNGNLTLENGASLMDGTGTTGGGGNVNGNITVKRHAATGAQAFNLFGTPADNVSVSVLGSTVYWFNEANNDATDFRNDWAAASGTMTRGLGYTAAGAGTVIFYGDPFEGTYQIPVTNTPSANSGEDGWNCLSNPYPSSLNAIAFLNANPLIANENIYLWDNPPATNPNAFTSNDYGVFNKTLGQVNFGGGNRGFNGDIASCQGFMVQVANSGNITFTNNMRGTQNHAFFRLSNPDLQRIKISVVNPNNAFNELMIGFLPDATEGYDINYDAYKMLGNQELALYTRLNGDAFAIQAFPPVTADRTVPLTLATTITGQFTFGVTLFDNFDETALVFLEDTETGHWQDLRLNRSYTCQVNAPGIYEQRFLVHFYPAMKIESLDATCEGEPGMITLHQPGSTEWDYVLTRDGHAGRESMFTGDGPTIIQSGADFNGTLRFTQLPEGIYHLHLSNASGYSLTRDIAIMGMVPVTAGFRAIQTVAGIGEPVQFTNISTGADNYLWQFGDGATSGDVSPVHAFQSEGVYTVKLLAGNPDCFDRASASIKIKRISSGLDVRDKVPVDIYVFHHTLYIKTGVAAPGKLTIYNMTGQLLMEKAVAGSVQMPWDAPAGVYLVMLRTGGETYTQRVTVLD